MALCPAYLGGALAELRDLRSHEGQLRWMAPASALGGIAAGIFLLKTNETTFRTLVPYLILLAAGLLAVEDRLRNWLIGRTDHGETVSHHNNWTMLAVFLASICGGYFGAGLSVIIALIYLIC